MDTEKIIKSALLELFNEGKSESEAYKEFSEIHTKNKITKKAVSNWYDKFRLEDHTLEDKKAASPKVKLTNERLIELIKENPNYSLEKLAKLADVSQSTISLRLKKINSGNKAVYYRKKDKIKFSDEFLIDLVNKNPRHTMGELAKLAGACESTISNRIKQINTNSQIVNYVKKQHMPEGFGEPNSKLTDKYVISLIKENPKLNTYELAELAGTSQRTILRRINRIKLSGENVDYVKKYTNKFTDEFLIDLVNKNPDASIEKLARLADVSNTAIDKRLKKINSSGVVINYVNKGSEPISKTKLTNESLIELVNENPDLSKAKLAKLAGCSESTISKRIKQINSKHEKINYTSKNPGSKITNDSLISLIKENPDLSMAELGKLAGVSYATISYRIKKINSTSENVIYIDKRSQKRKPETNERPKAKPTNDPVTKP